MFTTESKMRIVQLSGKEKNNLLMLKALKNDINKRYRIDRLELLIKNAFGHDEEEMKKLVYKKEVDELHDMIKARPYDKIEECYLECNAVFKRLLVQSRKAKSIEDIDVGDFKKYQAKFIKCGGVESSYYKAIFNSCKAIVKHIKTLIKYHSLFYTLQSYIDEFLKKDEFNKLRDENKCKTLDGLLILKYNMPSLKNVIDTYAVTDYTNILEDARKKLINMIKKVKNMEKYVLSVNGENVELLPANIRTIITRGVDTNLNLVGLKKYISNFMDEYNEAINYGVE